MSKNFGKRSTTASASTSIGMKKFCKVCHDAGKTESEYTSHYVRSSTGTDGVVVCPTLLAMNCRYCGTGGHTVKFCKELEKKKKAEERGARRAAFEKSDKKVMPVTEKKATAFAILDYDSEDERPLHKSVIKNTDFELQAVTKPQAFSYAAMASKPATNSVAVSVAIMEKPVTGLPSIQLPVSYEEYYQDNESYHSPLPLYRSNFVADSYLDANSDSDSDEEDYSRPIGKPAPWAKDYKQEDSSW